MELDFDIPQDALNAICTQGSNDLSVSEWFDKLGMDKVISLKDAKKHVSEHGFSPDDKSPRSWKEASFWLAAWQQFECNEEEIQ